MLRFFLTRLHSKCSAEKNHILIRRGIEGQTVVEGISIKKTHEQQILSCGVIALGVRYNTAGYGYKYLKLKYNF